jgi:xanthine dehydrogenase YagR molybdenum-binding subunit
VYDKVHGRVVTNHLADYLVPLNADVNQLEVEFIDKPDLYYGSLGARGVGEIEIVGVAAMIANAVYHAKGKRVRDLPIVLDAVL